MDTAAEAPDSVDRSPEEEALLAEAERVFPAGVIANLHLGDYLFVPIRGKGGRIYDKSGNEWIDYRCGTGCLILGHGHPAILDAVAKQIQEACNFAQILNEPAIRLAAKVIDIIPLGRAGPLHQQRRRGHLYGHARGARVHGQGQDPQVRGRLPRPRRLHGEHAARGLHPGPDGLPGHGRDSEIGAGRLHRGPVQRHRGRDPGHRGEHRRPRGPDRGAHPGLHSAASRLPRRPSRGHGTVRRAPHLRRVRDRPLDRARRGAGVLRRHPRHHRARQELRRRLPDRGGVRKEGDHETLRLRQRATRDRMLLRGLDLRPPRRRDGLAVHLRRAREAWHLRAVVRNRAQAARGCGRGHSPAQCTRPGNGHRADVARRVHHRRGHRLPLRP